MSEFKGIKWSLGGISGRMIKTNEYVGFVADVDTKKNALLISKAPEMLEELKHLVKALKVVSSMGATTPIIEHAEKLIKEATEL